MGYYLLQGGSEFTGQMRESDLEALSLCGGLEAPISIIPAAAAPDNNHTNAGKIGEQWFRSLGATQVRALPLIDRDSADHPHIAAELEQSRLIYLLGGFPGYLARTLIGTAALEAMERALDRDAVVAGSSAGAMVMCEHLYDPAAKAVTRGLGWIPNSCVLPHHDTFGAQWAQDLRARLPGATLIGIDEQTGAVAARDRKRWTVYGRGAVTIYKEGCQTAHAGSMSFSL